MLKGHKFPSAKLWIRLFLLHVDGGRQASDLGAGMLNLRCIPPGVGRIPLCVTGCSVKIQLVEFKPRKYYPEYSNTTVLQNPGFVTLIWNTDMTGRSY
jgi:hypothetical protein